jgi:tetratricopeptide (TPR) repeat protein
MERRLAVHARTAVIAAASLLASTTASAAPKGAEARAAFDKGVAAYKKADYAGASDALGRSFTLEADADTLYAWAQTERKLNHCDKAIELYGRLLEMDLPEPNKAAVRQQVEECKVIVAAQKPSEAEPDPAPTPPSESPGAAPSPPPERPETPPSTPSMWLNPVGLGLMGLGAIGLGAGAVFLAQGNSAEGDKETATTYGDFQRFSERATSRGRLGVIAAASGAVLLTAGIVYIVTRTPVEKQPVAIIVEPTGVGVAGRF